ncbi:MAG: TlpA family protein disulfide reductase [Rhodothermaceae bacterium]|nr:TlpA family protein disulfide reductase [Rhodothermaceae bacterium]
MRYLVILLLLSACTTEPAPPLKEQPGTITIIFGAHPEYRRNLPEGIAQYIDDHYIKQALRPDQQGDTLTIKTAKDMLGLKHTFPFQEKGGGATVYMHLYYAIQKGDSVRFTYDGMKPHAEVLNRDAPLYDLNYDLASWEALYEQNAPVRAFMFSFVFNPDWKKEETDENFRRHMEQVHAQDQAEIVREDALLDSLFDVGLLSEPAYGYRKAINYFRVMDRDVRRARVDQYVNQYVASIEAGESQLQQEGSEPDLSYEELAALGVIQYSLSDYVTQRFQIPTVSEQYDGSGLRYPDYPLKFDSTLQASWLPQKAKEVLLFSDLEGILQEYPMEYRFRYLSKFKEFVTDTALVNYITTQYSLEAGEEEEIILEDLEGNTSTFAEVLAGHAGKVVYIDWWAGWCAPCIRIMPEMRELEQSLDKQEAVILYISIDEDTQSWATSIDSLLYGSRLTNYRVSNKYVSKQFESFNIQFIPRYFLIDQEGEIVEEYAPGPGEESLNQLLAELLD